MQQSLPYTYTQQPRRRERVPGLLPSMIKAGPADALMMSHKVWARPIRCYQRVGTLLLFLQPAHQRSWSFPLSLLQDFFLGLPLGRGTPKREVAAPCAASWAKKAVSSMTLLIQNDLRWLLRRRGCGKVHAPRQRRTKQLHILIKIRSPCFSAACTRTRAHERLRVQIFTGKQPEIGGFGEKYTNCS